MAHMTVSKKKFEKAIANLQFDAVLNALEGPFDEQNVEEILTCFLQQKNALISRKSPMRLQRDQFLQQLQSHVEKELGPSAAASVEAFLENLKLFENGFDHVITALRESEAGGWRPEERVFAVLRYCCERVHEQLNLYADYVQRNGHLPHSGVITTAQRDVVDLDVGNSLFVNVATMTLLLEAYTGKWFKGKLVELLECSDDFCFSDRIAEQLVWTAVYWRRLEREAEKFRFLEHHLDAESEISPVRESLKLDDQCKVIASRPSEGMRRLIELDAVANRRLKDALVKNHTQNFILKAAPPGLIAAEHDSLVVGELPFLSEEEVTAMQALEAHFFVDIFNDKTAYCGLRLAEWLRGYAVLKNSFRGWEDRPPEALHKKVSLAELKTQLVTGGLNNSKAKLFIKAVLFGSSSDDLHDCPLIRLQGSGILIFGPALVSSNLASVVISRLASIGADFSTKGSNFEKKVVDKLTSNGIEAKSFKWKRNGEEYEYDVLALWGDTVFHFECKTHRLSDGLPYRQRRFFDCVIDDMKQTQRLSDALRECPEILEKTFGSLPSEMKVVSVVLNSSPFSIPDGIGGIYFWDAQAFFRFFERRYAGSYNVDRTSNKARAIREVDLWEAARPTPQAMLKQIRRPFQIAFNFEAMEWTEIPVRICDENLYLAEEIQFKEHQEFMMSAGSGKTTNGT